MMAVKPFKIGQYVMMTEDGIRNYGKRYRNTVFKINYVCPISFNFIGRESEGIVGEHFNDLVEIKDGKESGYLFHHSPYDSELMDEAERWK